MDAESSDARLIIAASETDADIYHASRFLAPDAFVFLQIGSEKLLLVSDLELDRARAQAQVDTVLAISRYQEAAKQSGIENPDQLHALHHLLGERGIKSLWVPRAFPIQAADFLRHAGYKVGFPSGSFFIQREFKTTDEMRIALIKDDGFEALLTVGDQRNFVVVKDGFLEGKAQHGQVDLLSFSDSADDVVCFEIVIVSALVRGATVERFGRWGTAGVSGPILPAMLRERETHAIRNGEFSLATKR